MWFNVHWSILPFRVVVTSVRLVSRASLSQEDAWRFGPYIRAPSSSELECFLYFAPCFLMQKDVLCLWRCLVCTVRECLCPYKYFFSSSPHFRLPKFLLVVRERSGSEGSRGTVACAVIFFAQSISSIIGMPPLLFPSFFVCCVLFMVECSWAVLVLFPSTIRSYSSAVLGAVFSSYFFVLVARRRLFA